MSPQKVAELDLSVLVTVVSGKEAVRRCLGVICRQMDFEKTEVIVPFDKWSLDVGDLAVNFPEVTFHLIEDLGLAASDNISSLQHRLYDRRRAIGLQLSRGKIIAMTEDHATPAEDWCEQIVRLHKQPYDVIGGVVENKVDRPLNWAWYYCDFGRYGPPLEKAEVKRLTDINIAYKRDAIMSVRDKWKEAYHETTVHWAMDELGAKMLLDGRMTVFQERPHMPLYQAFKERVSWGRIFAETRAEDFAMARRIAYGVGAVLLPPLLLGRAIGHMRRQRQALSMIPTILPYMVLLLIGWSFGESIGYLKGEPKT